MFIDRYLVNIINISQVKSAAYSVSFFKFFRSVKIVLNLKQTHYLPGETVFLGALIKNKSWKDVILSKIYIIQVSLFSSMFCG